MFKYKSLPNYCSQTTVAKFLSERLHNQAFWYFRVAEIDNHQRATLLNVESSQPLNSKVPYCQLRPHKTSVLHEEGISKVIECPTAITHNNVKDNKSHSLSSPQPTATSSKECEDGIVVLSSTGPKQCKTGLLPVKPANLGKNIASLVKTIRKEGEWLSDEHINHAQALLAKQCPQIDGFQAPSIFCPEGGQNVGTPKKNFVQIMNVTGDHWITVSNVGCGNDEAMIYDSLYKDFSPSVKPKFVKQMAYMVQPTSKKMTLWWGDIQKQKGSDDCGLFAIAVATCLAFGILPEECSWEQDAMHNHLCECFEKGFISPFPVSSTKRVHVGYLRMEDVEVYCHCKQPYTERVFMVECNNCLNWFHCRCEKVPKVIKKNVPFFCRDCK